MTTARRHVRTVALTAPSERLVRTGATLLADALRIATIAGGSPGRVLVIRSLTVGDIRADASPATLALAVDRRVAQLDAAAVAWDDPAAPHAPAVFFDDDCEPYVALALQLARHGRADAWFWPLAVREWRPALPRDDAFRTIVAGVLRTRAGPGALLRLVDELARAGAVDPLLGALRSEDGAALVQELRCSTVTGRSISKPVSRAETESDVTPPPASGRTAGLRLEPAWGDTAAQWIARWPVADARSIWLAACSLTASRPARLLDMRLPADAERAARELVPATDAPPMLLLPPAGAAISVRRGGAVATPRAESRGADHPALHAADARPAVPSGAPTAHAGLFFVVAVMSRLGMARVLASRPELIDADVPWRVLDRLRACLRVPDDDPVRAAMPPLVDPTPTIDALTVAWCAATRRWLRRSARIGLGALVRRPGRMTSTRTHIDLVFALRHADIRTRKAGLDVDPGWVPWLARVVRFHYRDD